MTQTLKKQIEEIKAQLTNLSSRILFFVVKNDGELQGALKHDNEFTDLVILKTYDLYVLFGLHRSTNFMD